MAKTFQCTIATPEGEMFNEAVDRVTLQTEVGEITILANHEPFVGLASSGEIVIESKGETQTFNFAGGVVEVEKGGKLVLLLKGSPGGQGK